MPNLRNGNKGGFEPGLNNSTLKVNFTCHISFHIKHVGNCLNAHISPAYLRDAKVGMGECWLHKLLASEGDYFVLPVINMIFHHNNNNHYYLV